jgi:hypothetical protein
MYVWPAYLGKIRCLSSWLHAIEEARIGVRRAASRRFAWLHRQVSSTAFFIDLCQRFDGHVD